MIIGLLGQKQSGKDTCADYLVKKHGFERFAFGDSVKEVCRILFGFNYQQLYGNKKEEIDPNLNITPREAFQKIGTEFGQNIIHELLPNLNIEKKTLWTRNLDNIDKSKNIVISDVRFKHEIDAIKKNGGIIIKINRNTIQNDFNKHSSEQEIFNISPFLIDFIIDNNGTLNELFEKINYLKK
jgi:flagellin-specific chaperone FliS